MKLSLPPLPGTDTAHPAFKIGTRNTAYFLTGIETWQPIGRDHIAAAAIAHYWTRQMNWAALMMGVMSRRYEVAFENWKTWSTIAAGSREFDGAEIVGYTPHEN